MHRQFFRTRALLLSVAILLLGFAALAPGAPAFAQGTTCNAVDISLVLDRSGSALSQSVQVTDFGNGLIGQFNLGSDATLFSVVSFGIEVFVTGLTDNLGALQSAVASTPDSDGTDITSALYAAQGTLNGGRSVAKVIVILTDGIHNAATGLPVTAANYARSQGTKIFAVAVNARDGVDLATINQIGDVVIGPFDLDELVGQITSLASTICSQLPPPPALGGCIAIPAGSVVGELLFNTQVYWAPGKVSPGIFLEPTPDNKTYWVIGLDDTGEYYKILLSCQFIWVPSDVMAPNYDEVWNGTPLPTRIVS